MVPSSAPRRRLSALLPAVAIMVAFAVTAPASALAGGDAATELTSLVNAERAAAGLPALQVAGDLVDVATRHSSRMASAGNLHHNANLASEVSNWQRLTENVGRGPDARTIHDALMASPSHAANIRDPNVSQVGVGVVVSGDTLWVTQVFRQPETAPEPAPPPPPPPAPPPPPPPPAPAPPPVPSPTEAAAAPPPPAAEPNPPPPGAATTSVPDRAEVVVQPAVAGPVQLASPPPDTTRLLAAAQWLVTVWLLMD